MKIIKMSFRHRATLLALVFVAAWLVVAPRAGAQSSGSYVNECSSGGWLVETTGCIYGDATGLTAYQESDLADSGYYDWYIGEVSDAQIYDGNTLVTDAGYNCNSVSTGQDCSGDGGESSYASANVGTVHIGDTYNFSGTTWVWYDPSFMDDTSDSYWENWGGAWVSVQVTSARLTPTITAWPTAGTITWGQSLASSTVSGGTASVAGAFAWTVPTTIPPSGTQSESVTFTPSDLTDYTTVTGSINESVVALTLSNPTINTGIHVINGGGAALVPLGNGLYSSALELVYVDTAQDVALAYSTDGLHYTNAGRISVPYGSGVAELDCTPVYPDHCGVAAANYLGTLYVAYNDYSCNCLHVLAGTPIPGYAIFSWSDVYDDTAHQLVTTPAMLKVQTGPTTFIIIRYGTTEGDNEAYSSVFNGSGWSTQDSNSTSRTQSTLFTIDGTNYAIDLSNPSYSGNINITELDNNGVAIPGTTNQLQGGDSGNITQGFSSTVYNGYGHCAFVTSMPPANNELQIFSTSDYYNFADGEFWGPQTYSNLQDVPYTGSYPGDFAIAVYPPQPSGSAQIVVAYSGDSNGDLYAASGTPPVACP